MTPEPPWSPAPTQAAIRARARRRAAVRRRRAVALAVAVVVLIVVIVVLLTGGGGVAPPPIAGVAVEAHSTDPFSYATSRADEFTARASLGNDNVLFTKSPGGALATAARVARWRPLIDRAVKGTDIDPNLLEGLVFVESAGRPGVIAGTSVEDAAGLTQILAPTATSLLGMTIDLGRSRALTAKIDAGASGARLRRLETQRAAADPRFDPATELAATVRYLLDAERTFHREDLAFESYHMGIGNLSHVLRDYDGGPSVPYVQLYFDVGPTRHAAAFNLLQSFGDDSSLYWWRILGAVRIMHEYRTDRAALRQETSLQLADASGATVLHPPGGATRYASPAALSHAYAGRALVPLPSNARALGLRYSAQLGAQAKTVSAPAALYRGLRPVALHELIAMADRIRALSGTAPLTVARTVEDGTYQRALGIDEPLAATGWQFAILRHYRSDAQAQAFQELLDRLQSLDLISWAPEGDLLVVTVAADAGSWRG